MIEVFKTIQAILQPSNVIFFLIALGTLFLFARKARLGKGFLVIGLLLYYLLSISVLSNLLLYPLEQPYRRANLAKAAEVDTVVLLTGGDEADVLRAGAIFEIYQKWEKAKNRSRRIIISGADPLTPEVDEVAKVKQFLVERGIPEDLVLMERESMNTRESPKHVQAMVGTAPFFLVTSAYHMSRSLREFRRWGMNPIPVAADFRTTDHYTVLNLVPSIASVENCDRALHEYGGMIFYRFLNLRPKVKE